MAAAAVESPVQVGTVRTPTTSTAVTNPVMPPDEQAAEILRQVEYYFSEENLPSDAHLLGRLREGNGWTSLSEICGFRKMRDLNAKPRTRVAAILRNSTVVEVSENGKRLKRRHPLQAPLIVEPRAHQPNTIVVPEGKPWLTKGMLKPTGFEKFATDAPITPADFAVEREDYHPDNNFTSRIEIAITRFCSRRKMHQGTKAVFERFMIFGGIDFSPSNQFIGGLTDEEKSGLTKRQFAERTSNHAVSDLVYNDFDPEKDASKATWIVDFEGVAKGFLSSQFTSFFNWYDDKQVLNAANVLRNFYNYLLLHDVCLEYKGQLLAARRVCDQAEDELPKLREVDRSLPGDFNTACSTLFGGRYADLYTGNAEWAHPEDSLGWSEQDALMIFMTGVAAYGTNEQFEKAEMVRADISALKVISSENIGLEIVGVEFCAGEAKNLYSQQPLQNTVIRPIGKLRCKRWTVPHAAPVDLPPAMLEVQPSQTYEFLIDDDTLQNCVPGMKIECCVKELEMGIKWIDSFTKTYASFFVWLPNEWIRERKAVRGPKGWMKRRMVEQGSMDPSELDASETVQANEEQQVRQGDNDDESYTPD